MSDIMSQAGELYYKRGTGFFVNGEYEKAVADFIEAYNLGYDRKQILENLYSCFIWPNEEEFRKNYGENSGEFTQLSFEECALDFIPVSEDRFYIFDRGEECFRGIFELDKVPVQGEKIKFHDILYADTWDIREILPDMKENFRTVYVLLDEQLETKFASFFKLPRFKELYLNQVICFKNEAVMRAFFEEYERIYLPKQIVCTQTNDAAGLICEIHNKRISRKRTERANIFLSICILSCNNGAMAYNSVRHLLQSTYDNEIEIIVLKLGSTEDTTGYQQIRQTEDSRVRYYEFPDYQKNRGVLKALELAKGTFAVLAEDGSRMDLEQMETYFNLLKTHFTAGIILTNAPGQKTYDVYEKGIMAVFKVSDLKSVAGITCNMGLIRCTGILEQLAAQQGNKFLEAYLHIALAMLSGVHAEFVVSGLVLWEKCNMECEEPDTMACRMRNCWIAQQNEVIKYLYDFPGPLSEKDCASLRHLLKERLLEMQWSDDRWLGRDSMNEEKKKLKSAAIHDAVSGDMEKWLCEYEEKYPYDLDLHTVRAWFLLKSGQMEAAYETIRKALRINPYNYAVNQMARLICRETERYTEAVEYDTILLMLQREFKVLPPVESWYDQLAEKITAEYESLKTREEDIEQYRKEIKFMEEHKETAYGLDDQTYYQGGLNKRVIGTVYEDRLGNQKYNAYYYDAGVEDICLEEKLCNWTTTKLECMEVIRAKELTLGNSEYLLPVLQENTGIPYKITAADGKSFLCKNKKAVHFDYYRLPPHTAIKSESELLFGKPIVLRQNPEQKKLVLNIFVDGISQKVLEEENFARLMPYTYKFFSKGVQCSNVYTAGEWTLPSLASYVTGVGSANHMVIHNKITNNLPEDITVLAEYFHEAGYYTAKIDGDWRSSLAYGYGRGMDRVIYQHQNTGFKAEQVVADATDHMELMKETNQFVWMGVGELHNIADGFTMNASVQAEIPLENRTDEDTGKTSVKQNFSYNKRAAYIRQMKYIDRYLGVLYTYIEENYRDSEIVVSLFGDHGQGYLVNEAEEHFLADGRSKVAMMFRGGNLPAGTVCEELISTCDYVPILCKLAGIPLKHEDIDGNLPVFFGGSRKREYAITESIHPGDAYQAAIVSDDYKFYYTSEGVVEYDGRFEPGKFSCRLTDKEGNEYTDEACVKYLDVLMRHAGSLMVC